MQYLPCIESFAVPRAPFPSAIEQPPRSARCMNSADVSSQLVERLEDYSARNPTALYFCISIHRDSFGDRVLFAYEFWADVDARNGVITVTLLNQTVELEKKNIQ